MELIKYSFVLYLQHGCHDVKCKHQFCFIGEQYTNSSKVAKDKTKIQGLQVRFYKFKYLYNAVNFLFKFKGFHGSFARNLAELLQGGPL